MSGKVWLQVALATVGGLIILVGIGMCFAAIGDTADPVERMEARATERAVPTATAIPKAKATVIPAGTAEPVCFKPDEQAYIDKMKKSAEILAEDGFAIEDSLQMAARDQTLYLDSEWQAGVLRRLENSRLTVLAFKKVLVPESVEHIHADYIRALELVEEMVPLMSAAIMELNVYKLEQAFDLVDESSVFIGSAADKKEAYCLQKFFEAMAEESN